jgi:hypothetical protein
LSPHFDPGFAPHQGAGRIISTSSVNWLKPMTRCHSGAFVSIATAFAKIGRNVPDFRT